MTENIIIEIIKGIVTLIVALLSFYGAYSGAKNITKKGDKDNIKLSSHPIFSRADLNKNVVLTYFQLENKGKEKIFKDILIKHMSIYKTHVKTLCTNIESNNVNNSSELYSLSVDILNKIINDIRTFYLYDNNYTTDDVRTMTIVMDKYNHWDKERELEIATRIQEICNSVFYCDLYTKAVAILDTFLFVMNDTVSDANKTLNSINGGLKGLKYKGVEI